MNKFDIVKAVCNTTGLTASVVGLVYSHIMTEIRKQVAAGHGVKVEGLLSIYVKDKDVDCKYYCPIDRIYKPVKHLKKIVVIPSAALSKKINEEFNSCQD